MISEWKVCVGSSAKSLLNWFENLSIKCSGVARAFPGGRLAHPEDQNEEENK